MRAPRIWDEQVLPRLVDASCSGASADRWRRRVCRAPGVRGRVLEIGFGSGANLPHYGEQVDQVLAVEPADLAWRRAADRVTTFGRPVERIGLDAARLDLPDGSVDAVVSTWTLCTVPRLSRALGEIARVLRPGGALHLAEHTISEHRHLASAQRLLQPAWGLWAGGCHLDRDIPGELERAAYRLVDRHQRGWFVSVTAHPTHG